MAAYAAIVSLMHIIDQIQHHPSPPISLDKEQIEFLIEKVTFLQDYLEAYCHGGDSKEADGLERRIADATYAAEDVIESRIVDQILTGSRCHEEEISSVDFYQRLQKVIEEMDFIKKEVMEAKRKTGIQDLLHISSISAGSLISAPSTDQNSTMVGFDDVLNEVMNKLTGQQSNLQIIPIVGMGGIGKTTLARNIYVNPLIVQHFDVLAWVTISQEYSVREILLEILCCQEGKENLSRSNEDKLGEKLYKSLSGMRYLVIMDDIWSIEVWDKVRFFFPDNNSGSRIMITTRLANLASQLSGSHGLEMNFLDDSKSWNLLCQNVFRQESCPRELEEIGKKIARNCKGLPLSIVVIGGLLTKSKWNREYWEYIAENLNSIVNLEENERCLKILYMSYKELPVHLKPCFLYMGVFPEDSEVRVSKLIKLWVAEGFLKPIGGKSLEEVAEEYLEELIDRNLILVHLLGSSGKTKFCKIHDLFRDLCLREANKRKFLCVIRNHSPNIPQGRITQRSISIHQSTSDPEYLPRVLHSLQYVPLARSLIWDFNALQFESLAPFLKWNVKEFLQSVNLRLLSVFIVLDDRCSDIAQETYNMFFPDGIFNFFNLRYLSYPNIGPSIPSSVYRLWNLHTLVARHTTTTAPSEIWKMPLLRHVEFKTLYLTNPPSGHMDRRDDFILGNLQTLLTISIPDLSEEVVKRIPNIKKLKIYYEEFKEGSQYCLNNLGHLHKLESLGLGGFFDPENMPRHLVQNLTLPHSLKKLTLEGTHLHWEDLTTKIGSLPLLEVLKLKMWSCIGPEWETVQGQFRSLKFLLIEMCLDLESWITDNTHFPRLEHLVLLDLHKLKEIPSSMGDIPTLQSIQLEDCGYFVVDSAKRIQAEQEELGNESLKVLFNSRNRSFDSFIN